MLPPQQHQPRSPRRNQSQPLGVLGVSATVDSPTHRHPPVWLTAARRCEASEAAPREPCPPAFARRRREEDYRETFRACGQPVQKSTISGVHADLYRDVSRLPETPEPSTVARVPLAHLTDDFKHAQIRRKEYVPTQVGHDTLQTSPTSEEALDLGSGPPQFDGLHPEDGPISRHRRKMFSPGDAPTPAQPLSVHGLHSTGSRSYPCPMSSS